MYFAPLLKEFCRVYVDLTRFFVSSLRHKLGSDLRNYDVSRWRAGNETHPHRYTTVGVQSRFRANMAVVGLGGHGRDKHPR